ncbi:MAG: insulinase family protein, partial [Caldilineaceae bacterium]|nr:insulinase family protein [Caldilineaceae bacterium]
SVLAGSEKYPVKDAFNELGKRTLNTFLNAMTWPDRTIYPTCSNLRADYFNLASVYLDLVFKPLLKVETFKQEGHHLTFEDLERLSSALRVSGVVYNEMKGVYSSPESVAEREMLRALYPDTTYGVDSGGDPDVIPQLSYEQFKAFHRRFYSPSNARFMLYGDVSLADNLSFLADYLTPFEQIAVDATIELQPRWTAPRDLAVAYPVG